MQPLVSVIIPTFNRAHLIGETLDSLIKQTYTNWECIVVDDGSTDETKHIVLEYVDKDSRFQYYLRPETYKRGGNGARNFGFEMGKGDLVQWFDDDDLMLENYLENKIVVFKPSIDFVICTGFSFNPTTNTKEFINIKIKTYLFKDYVLYRSKIFTPSLMFKRKFLKGTTMFNPIILRGQETEFFSRLFFNVQESQYAIIDEPLFLYRQHQQTKSQINKQYVKAFKASETYVVKEHIKRAILIKDSELIQYFYRVLVNFLFRAIENQDRDNVIYITKTILPILKPVNNKIVFQLKLTVKCLTIFKRGFYKLEMYFKNYTII